MTSNLLATRTHEGLVPEDPTDRLGFFEAVIDESVRIADVEQQRAWLALEQIHEHELWRLDGHRSFSAYIEVRWATSRVNAYRQIAWARSARELPGIADPTDDTEVVSRVTTLAEQKAAEKKAAAAKAAAARQAAIDAASKVTEPGPAGEGDPAVVDPTVLDGDPDDIPPDPPKPPGDKTEQLSLFSIIEGLAEWIAVEKVAVKDRPPLAGHLRAAADMLDPPKQKKTRKKAAAPAPAPAPRRSASSRPSCTCTKGPTKSLTVSGLCTACHGWFR